MSQRQLKILNRCPLIGTSSVFLVLGIFVSSSRILAGESFLKEVIKFQNITIEKGLSQSSVNCVLQDRAGFIWFGTEDGLNRYDGYELKVYKKRFGDPNSLPHNHINVLIEDGNGNLWLGTRGGGIIEFDPTEEQFTGYSSKDPNGPIIVKNDDVRALYRDHDGTIWVGYKAGGISRFDPGQRKSTKPPLTGPNYLATRTVHAIYGDEGGGIWLGVDGGLVKLTATQEAEEYIPAIFPYRDSSQGQAVYAMIQEPGTNPVILWLATLHGLKKFNSVNNEITHFRESNQPSHAVFTDRSDYVWLGTETGGVERFSKQSSIVRHFRNHQDDAHSLCSNWVLSIFRDDGHNLWIGTSKGVSLYSKSRHKFKHYRGNRETGTLSDNYVLSFSEGDGGHFWIGTSNGLNRINTEFDSPTRYYYADSTSGSLSHNKIFSLLKAKDNTLWVGTAAGLNRYDPKSDTFIRNVVGRQSDATALCTHAILALHETVVGDSSYIWAGTLGHGLFRLNPSSGKIKYYTVQEDAANSILNNNVSVIYQQVARAGSPILWLGTFGGLSRMDTGQETFTNYRNRSDNENSLSHNTVFALAGNAADKTLLIGTRGGLNVLDLTDFNIKVFTTESGLPNDVIYAIIPENDATFWISTNKGIAHFDPKKESFRNYDLSDGLQSNEFNSGAGYRNKNGEIFLGGINGFNRFQTNLVGENLRIPPVVITDARVFDKSIFDREFVNRGRLDLNYKEDFISFRFAALDYAAPEKNQYAYMLDGFDDDWIYCGTRRYAGYTNLDGGNYVLRIKAANNDGIWNESGTSVKISVAPPPWKTWWAYMLYFTTVIGSVWGYIKIKTAQQQKKIEEQQRVVAALERVDKLKDDFLANTSHELRTPLNGIIGIAESLHNETIGKLNESQKHNLSLVISNGKRLSLLVSNLLDFSKLKNSETELDRRALNLYRVVQDCVELMEPGLKGKSLDILNQVSDYFPPVYADENRLQQILLNLIGNAIKFTESGEVAIACVEKGPRAEVSVKDTGIGIEAAKLDRIFVPFEQADPSSTRKYGGTGLGLSITKTLVELLGGEIRVESDLGKGSCFIFTLPMTFEGTSAQKVERVDFDAKEQPSWDEHLEGVAGGLSGSAWAPPDMDDIAYPITEVGAGSAADGFEILIVDDEPVNIQVLQNFLSVHGHSTFQAKDGVEALERIAEIGVPDLVLLDIMMPRLDGYEVCKRIRQKHPLYELPILMLTAKDKAKDLAEAFAVGANDYLVKPFDNTEIIARVNTLLSLKFAVREQQKLTTLKEELNVARSIQEAILPKETPRIKGIEIETRYEPMAEVGGDFYDFLVVDETKIGILMGDVSGHGIPAALVGSMLKIAFCSQEYLADNPEELLANINNTLEDKLRKSFLTASYTYIDLEQMQLVHGDAGHMPLIVLRRKSKALLEHKPNGIVMGWDRDISFPSTRISLRASDRLIIYTDGIAEAQNERGEMFEKRFFELVKTTAEHGPSQVIEVIFDELHDWNPGQEPADDMTMVVVDVL